MHCLQPQGSIFLLLRAPYCLLIQFFLNYFNIYLIKCLHVIFLAFKMMAHQKKQITNFTGKKMQKFKITYANNQSFTIEATCRTDYVAKVRSKFLAIFLDTGIDYSKREHYSEAIE